MCLVSSLCVMRITVYGVCDYVRMCIRVCQRNLKYRYCILWITVPIHKISIPVDIFHSGCSTAWCSSHGCHANSQRSYCTTGAQTGIPGTSHFVSETNQEGKEGTQTLHNIMCDNLQPYGKLWYILLCNLIFIPKH